MSNSSSFLFLVLLGMQKDERGTANTMYLGCKWDGALAATVLQ